MGLELGLEVERKELRRWVEDFGFGFEFDFGGGAGMWVRMDGGGSEDGWFVIFFIRDGDGDRGGWNNCERWLGCVNK